MKRTFGALCLGLALFGAAAQASAAAQPPRAMLRNFVCKQALQPIDRAVAVDAVMRPVAGTVKMALRFQLLARANNAADFTEVSGGDLGTWISPPSPTLGRRPSDRWILNKPVVNLSAPVSYRLQVTFRWTGSGEQVLRTTIRLSPRCHQPELRPDLQVRRIEVLAAAKPNQNIYLATIANGGATAASSFEVWFSPGGGRPVQMRTVDGLAPHTTRRLTFVGPACAGGLTPNVVVDPTSEALDANRANNSLTTSCPARPAGGG